VARFEILRDLEQRGPNDQTCLYKRDFSRVVPETLRMVGWSTGTLMVRVDVAVAHRGPRDVRDGRMVASCLGGQSKAHSIPAGRI
jgi:hypothetical protein